ncbi:MAG: hypothetical protein B7O98_03045 [Zestosphaera tikiterensis]|uniref:Ribonuclease P protein component 1 n=1 Tax=Zestosphaera tikiterensis TaxID=1973259 RepID=A0A2R7Y7A2_9CREN|nr:MAG: hypothetical protein B7O98_03045 [Zestosphaera tikiterensis]
MFLKRSRRNLIYHELIGLQVIVKDHTDPSLMGVKGLVVDETQNMLEIERLDDGRRLKVPKAGGAYLFKLENNSFVLVNGDKLLGRPEDRLKRVVGG